MAVNGGMRAGYNKYQQSKGKESVYDNAKNGEGNSQDEIQNIPFSKSTEFARALLVAVKKETGYAGNLINESHNIAEKAGKNKTVVVQNDPTYIPRLIAAARKDGLSETTTNDIIKKFSTQ